MQNCVRDWSFQLRSAPMHLGLKFPNRNILWYSWRIVFFLLFFLLHFKSQGTILYRDWNLQSISSKKYIQTLLNSSLDHPGGLTHFQLYICSMARKSVQNKVRIIPVINQGRARYTVHFRWCETTFIRQKGKMLHICNNLLSDTLHEVYWEQTCGQKFRKMTQCSKLW